MYINQIISNLNAWEQLLDKHHLLLEEIEISLLGLEVETEKKDSKFSIKDLYINFNGKLRKKNWNYGLQMTVGDRVIGAIDFEKDKVGLEFSLRKFAFLESFIFVKLPYYLKAKKLDIAIFLVPSKSLKQQMPSGIADFEHIKEILTEINFSLKYPFAILEVDIEKKERKILKLETDYNLFLLGRVHQTLEELIIEGENEYFDFKEILPKNKKIAQEVCGFANNKNGGLIIVGISDDGQFKGIESQEWDKLNLRLTDVIRHNCSPTPKFKNLKFPLPNQKGRILIIIDVYELELKPCMTFDRVYIRRGASTRPANSKEIRNLLIN